MHKRPQQEILRTTYFLSGWHTKAGLARLMRLDRLTTHCMGGILPEQPDPTLFHRVLDIGCGTGGWAIDAAQMYPSMSLVGIDIDAQLLHFAHAEARACAVSDRVQFRTMDALGPLDFPDESFDLVNLRLAGGFLRTWDWPNVLREIARVTQPGGVIRIVELETAAQSSSAAYVEVARMLTRAFFHAGHFFTPEPDGLTAHLESLLRVPNCQQIQKKTTPSVIRSGTEIGQIWYEDGIRSASALRPFIQKWGGVDIETYDSLCKQKLTDMQEGDFYCTGIFVTVWGRKSALSAKPMTDSGH
jgi:ubiquinone/menaquinone biosynthesis C-methylase UbiE